MLNIYQANTYYSKHFFNCDVTPRRTVAFYELEYYHSGTGFSCINGVRYPHVSGMVVFAKPGQTRFSIGSFQCECIHFNCNEPLFLQFASGLPDVTLPQDASILPLMQEVAEKNTAQTPFSPLAIYSLILRILSILGEASNQNPPVSFERDRYFTNITAVKEYLDNHFQEKITLQTLSRHAYLSPNFMRIKFQELIGISPHAYLEELRMGHACRLLVESTMSIADIASACGFDSPSYLDTVFRRKKGLTPVQYRVTHTADPLYVLK